MQIRFEEYLWIKECTIKPGVISDWNFDLNNHVLPGL